MKYTRFYNSSPRRAGKWWVGAMTAYVHKTLEPVPKQSRDELACSHEQNSSHGPAMGLHPPPPAATSTYWTTARTTVVQIEAILYVLITGCRWQDLPREYGAPTTAWRRLQRWGEAGVWDRIWRTALARLDDQGQLDWTIAFLDGSFVPAKRGGEQGRLDPEGQGHQVDVGGRRQWTPLGVPPGQCWPCGGAPGSADLRHDSGGSTARASEAAAREARSGPGV